MKIFLIFLAAIGLAFLLPKACKDPSGARRILEQNGYTKIEITGWRPFMGDEGDVWSTGFSAKSSNGSKVTGAVTSGILKGSTIRFD